MCHVLSYLNLIHMNGKDVPDLMHIRLEIQLLA